MRNLQDIRFLFLLNYLGISQECLLPFHYSCVTIRFNELLGCAIIQMIVYHFHVVLDVHYYNCPTLVSLSYYYILIRFYI